MSELPDNKDNSLRPNKLSAELRLLARAIEAFKENAIVQREQITAQKEHTKHDKEVQLLERQYNRRTNITIAVITLIGIIATVFVGLHVSAQENEVQRHFQMEQEMQVQAREQGQELETKIRDEIRARDRLNDSIAQARFIRESSLLYCQNGKFLGDLNKYKENYLQSGYKFLNARFSIFEIFGPEIQDEAQKLLALIASQDEDICNSDVEKRLQLLQHDLNEMMNKVIFDDKEKRKILLLKEKAIARS